MNELEPTDRMGRRMRRGTLKPTAADVARASGVSPMTVSRVINGDAPVSDATRDRVMEAVRALNYVPNAAARNLAGARQCRIALVYSNPSAGFLSELLMGALGEASLHDAVLVVEPSLPDEPVSALIGRLESHRATAVLLPPPLCDQAPLLAALNEAGMPVARIAGFASATSTYSIGIDDTAAARAMTKHLLARGHRAIGFISGDPNQTASALRRRGWEAALAEAGLAPNPDFIAEGDFTYRSGLVAAARLLDSHHRPTAILASNDDMAAAVVATAHRLGIDVPRDLSVCGFDDTAIATTVWPELTTVRQPIADMARRAVRALARQAPDGAAPRHERLDFQLVLRGTDGSPLND